MAEFSLREVVVATGGVASGEMNIQFCAVSTDTRTIQPGSLFIALTGERFDGYDYIDNAIEKGATGVIVSRMIDNPGVISIIVRDTKRALQDLACYHRQRYDIPVIGITGSNGKTTTKDMTAAVLAARLRTLKTEANFNNEIGLPQTLLRLDSSHQVAVVEMGMRGKGEIRELAAIALPSLAVITTVGETHIELLGSVENIAKAKAELVESIAANGTVVLNSDNPHVRAMAAKTSAKVVFFGLHDADITACNIETNESGMTFDCCHQQVCFPVTLATFGKHNIYNALAAITVGLELGLTTDEVAQGIATFVPDAMRLHVEESNRFRLINDSYNASPLSMIASIEALRDIAAGGRTVAVLGDMLELGNIAVEAHRRIGKKLLESKVDVVVTVGDLAKNIEAEVLAGGGMAVPCENHEAARKVLLELLQPGDTILLKGSRSMKMEKLLDVFN